MERYQAGSNIPLLEGVRGLAIVLVMCYHFGPVLQWGWIGVDLFFVLSGFLISKAILSYPLSLTNVMLFFRNRMLRIVPAYFFVLLLFFIVIPFLYPFAANSSFRQLQDHQWYYWLFMVDYWYAVSSWPEMVYLVPIWSLSVEFKFYLIWPLLLYFARNCTPWQQVVVLLVIAAVAITFRMIGTTLFDLSPNFRYVLFVSRFDSFAIGGILFIAIHNQLINLRALFWILPFLLFSLVFLSFLLFGNINGSFSDPVINSIGFTFIAIGWASLIGSLLHQQSLLDSFFISESLRKIGLYSYSIYLIHYPVWLVIVKLNWNIVVQVLFAAICSVAIGRTSYFLLEKPFLKIKKHPIDGK